MMKRPFRNREGFQTRPHSPSSTPPLSVHRYRTMLTTALLTAVLASTAFAAPPPQQLRFQVPDALAQDYAHLKQDLKGAWNKVHKSVDEWAEQGVRKFDQVEHDGINCELRNLSLD